MSASTARTWASTISGSTAATAVTSRVFWAVIAVIAEVPCTPQAAKAFRSAWIPAPPPESEPAIVSAVGVPGAIGGSSAFGAGPQGRVLEVGFGREDRVAADRGGEQAAVLVADLGLRITPIERLRRFSVEWQITSPSVAVWM